VGKAGAEYGTPHAQGVFGAQRASVVRLCEGRGGYRDTYAIKLLRKYKKGNPAFSRGKGAPSGYLRMEKLKKKKKGKNSGKCGLPAQTTTPRTLRCCAGRERKKSRRRIKSPTEWGGGKKKTREKRKTHRRKNGP